mgnify:CR=1 FL=1
MARENYVASVRGISSFDDAFNAPCRKSWSTVLANILFDTLKLTERDQPKARINLIIFRLPSRFFTRHVLLPIVTNSHIRSF